MYVSALISVAALAVAAHAAIVRIPRTVTQTVQLTKTTSQPYLTSTRPSNGEAAQQTVLTLLHPYTTVIAVPTVVVRTNYPGASKTHSIHTTHTTSHVISQSTQIHKVHITATVTNHGAAVTVRPQQAIAHVTPHHDNHDHDDDEETLPVISDVLTTMTIGGEAIETVMPLQSHGSVLTAEDFHISAPRAGAHWLQAKGAGYQLDWWTNNSNYTGVSVNLCNVGRNTHNHKEDKQGAHAHKILNNDDDSSDHDDHVDDDSNDDHLHTGCAFLGHADVNATTFSDNLNPLANSIQPGKKYFSLLVTDSKNNQTYVVESAQFDIVRLNKLRKD